MIRTHQTLTAALAITVASLASAQSRQVPAPAQSRPVVIENGTIHPVSGPAIENGHVVFDDGRITHVGDGPAPSVTGADRLDATGLHVYPGLISSSALLGLSETGSLSETQDYRELGDFKPEVRAGVAVNPDSDLIPVTRANGILTAFIMPQGGVLSGRGSVIRLDGWTWEEMAIVPDAGVVISWPRTEAFTSRWMRTSSSEQRSQTTKNLEEIDAFFDAAAHYVKLKDADPAQRTDLRYEALRTVLDGSQPVFIRAASAGQIESAVAWTLRRGMTCVIVGGGRADEAIPLLVRHDIPVIIEGTHNLPRRRHDAYDHPFKLPLRLHEAGVRFSIASGAEAAHERDLNHAAATAAAYGLPVDEAIRAVTQTPAEILGLGDELGTLEAGKRATLIVTTGNPLEIVHDTLIAFIDGRRIDLGSRHKALYAKYREKYRQIGLLDASIGMPARGVDRGEAGAEKRE